jgi:hypothetical protein
MSKPIYNKNLKCPIGGLKYTERLEIFRENDFALWLY